MHCAYSFDTRTEPQPVYTYVYKTLNVKLYFIKLCYQNVKHCYYYIKQTSQNVKLTCYKYLYRFVISIYRHFIIDS